MFILLLLLRSTGIRVDVYLLKLISTNSEYTCDVHNDFLVEKLSIRFFKVSSCIHCFGIVKKAGPENVYTPEA